MASRRNCLSMGLRIPAATAMPAGRRQSPLKSAERVPRQPPAGQGGRRRLAGEIGGGAGSKGPAPKMSDGLIIDNVVTFLMVGQEPTAQALTWALDVLALRPEWQDKVRDEVRRVMGAGPLGANAARAACRVGGGVS